MHFIPILDIGIAKRPKGEYTAYDDGVDEDVFLKAATKTEDFIGQVWPGDSVFPDFFNTKAVTWW
jgi:alpha-glucosidase (family GH31 glycosyl hydrolase)